MADTDKISIGSNAAQALRDMVASRPDGLLSISGGGLRFDSALVTAADTANVYIERVRMAEDGGFLMDGYLADGDGVPLDDIRVGDPGITWNITPDDPRLAAFTERLELRHGTKFYLMGDSYIDRAAASLVESAGESVSEVPFEYDEDENEWHVPDEVFEGIRANVRNACIFNGAYTIRFVDGERTWQDISLEELADSLDIELPRGMRLIDAFYRGGPAAFLSLSPTGDEIADMSGRFIASPGDEESSIHYNGEFFTAPEDIPSVGFGRNLKKRPEDVGSLIPVQERGAFRTWDFYPENAGEAAEFIKPFLDMDNSYDRKKYASILDCKHPLRLATFDGVPFAISEDYGEYRSIGPHAGESDGDVILEIPCPDGAFMRLSVPDICHRGFLDEPIRTKLFPQRVNMPVCDELDFSHCEKGMGTYVKSVCIPDGVTKISGAASPVFPELESVRIPGSVTKICDGVFHGCESLKEIHIPDGVTVIDKWTFYGCVSLAEIHIPDSVTEIGEGAFEHCKSLTKIHIPDSVTEIGEVAFSCCTSLTEIHIPDSVTKIRFGAFSYCENLTEIHIPDSVTEIGSGAFRNCTSLTNIHIPGNVNEIYELAFAYCTGLSSIEICSDNSTYKSEGNCCLSKDGSRLIFGCKTSVIPSSVTEMDSYAFCGCKALTEINIPDGVAEISRGAFEDCESLTEIHIPDSMTKIGDWAFYGCVSLAEIHIPDGVMEISEGAFHGCTSLTNIHIPDGVTELRGSAFSGCTSLTNIHIPDSVTKIGGATFYGCVSLAEIHIPDGVTEISECAFGDCTSLTNIHIPDSVTEIGKCVFWGCNVNVTCSPKVAELLKDQPGIRSITVVSKDRTQSPETGRKQESSMRNYGISPNLLRQAGAEHMKGEARNSCGRSGQMERNPAQQQNGRNGSDCGRRI